MRNQLVLASTVALACAWLLVGASHAAPAKSKLSGDAYYFHLGEVYDAHAYEHASILHECCVEGEQVPMGVLEEEMAAIRSNVEAANRAYQKLSDAAKKNPTTAKKLAEIAKFHAGILEHCDKRNTDTKKTTIQIKQGLTSAYSVSRQAAASQDILSEELAKPGRGVFSD